MDEKDVSGDERAAALQATQQLIPAVPSVFGTGISITATRWTCVLTVTDAAIAAGQAIDVPVAHVKLSWPLTKALHAILTDLLAKYEEEEAPIALPKSFLDRPKAGEPPK